MKVVGLASASYDAASHSVRLDLRKPFKKGTLRLTIDHAAALAANGKGLAGDYVATGPWVRRDPSSDGIALRGDIRPRFLPRLIESRRSS